MYPPFLIIVYIVDLLSESMIISVLFLLLSEFFLPKLILLNKETTSFIITYKL